MCIRDSAYTEQEGKLLISLLEEQKTWHEGVNSSIVLKHESELIRLRAEIKQAEAVSYTHLDVYKRQVLN